MDFSLLIVFRVHFNWLHHGIYIGSVGSLATQARDDFNVTDSTSMEYFSFYGIFCNPNVAGASGAAPGECYYYLRNPFKIGMQLHLYTILPAAFLVCFQFVPAIRHKVILFHRINGYLVIILSSIASAGAIIIAPHAFGGDMATRTAV